MTATYGRPHTVASGCHPLLGVRVLVVDVKDRRSMDVIGRSGMIHHDSTFGHDYLRFDDGGSLDPDVAVLERKPTGGLAP